MNNGTFVAALSLSGLLGVAVGLVLAPASASAPVPVIAAPPAVDDDGPRLRTERDHAAAEAEALRIELDRERAARLAAARPVAVAGRWFHSVDGNPPAALDLRADGELVCGELRARWRLEGSALRMSWPSGDAPGGAWEDLCVVSADGASYEGRNQIGSRIRGSRNPD